MRRVRSAGGFTLIEVLVAATIIVSSMGVLMQLFASGLMQANKVEDPARRIIIQREVGNRLRHVNPAGMARGEGIVQGWRYYFVAKQVREFRPVTADLGEREFPKQIGLFELDVTVERDERDNFGWTVTRLGWRDSG